MEILMIEEQLRESNPLAKLTRKILADAGIVALSIIGAPGCGKTALIQETMKRLGHGSQVRALNCNAARPDDLDRGLPGETRSMPPVMSPGSRREITHIYDVLQRLDLEKIELLLIEDSGRSTSANAFDLGQTLTAYAISATEDVDTDAIDAALIRKADVVILSRTDLLRGAPTIQLDFRRQLDADCI